MEQKHRIKIGDLWFSMVPLFESNFREKSPVIAEVLDGAAKLKEGIFIVCHHNHFFPPSPYHIQDDLFSIPFNKQIFGQLHSDGTITPLNGNIFGKRVEIPSAFPLPPELVKTYIDRVIVEDGGQTEFHAGQIIFHRPHAGYDIVYNVDGKERRVTKVMDDMVVGYKN